MSVYKYLIAGLLITGMSSTASAAGLNYCQNLFSAEETAYQPLEEAPAVSKDAEKAFSLANIYTSPAKLNCQQAISWLNRAANLGHAEAAYYLGVAYQYGKGTSKDISAAIDAYRLASTSGDAQAQRNLADIYHNGPDIYQDLTKAFSLYQQSASANLPDSQYSLGLMYLKGQGTEVDEQKAIHWLSLAADNHNVNAQLTLGALLTGRDPAASVKWYKHAADQHNPYALLNLASAYAKGRGVRQDYRKAQVYASLAGRFGHPKSAEFLATLPAAYAHQSKPEFAVATPVSATQTAPAASATATATGRDPNRLRDYQWVTEQPKREYFAQLAQFKTLTEVSSYIKQYKLSNAVDYFPAKTKLGQVYMIIYRDGFNGVQTTTAGLNKLLPKKLHKNVWIRTFESLQKGMRPQT